MERGRNAKAWLDGGSSFATGAVGVWAGSMECFSERPTPQLMLCYAVAHVVAPASN